MTTNETTTVTIDDVKVAETTHKDIVPIADVMDEAAEIYTAEKAAETKAKPKATPKPTPKDCVNGHPRTEFWTVTAGGRKYCKQCARDASVRTRAKHGRRAVKVELSDGAWDAIRKAASARTTSTQVREELHDFLVAHERTS